ncbi:hypothetical protein GQ568_02555 [Patescibacteria group bacterium]|nr:hypothetical protein [Patescibacteria group bacterium]
MPEVIDYTYYHSDNPNATIIEKDFKIVRFEIGQKTYKGRDVYGFFITDKEWKEKVSAVICRDGWFEVPLIAYKKWEAIPIGPLPASVDYREIERISNKKNKENFVGTEAWMRKELIELGIPVRKIKI